MTDGESLRELLVLPTDCSGRPEMWRRATARDLPTMEIVEDLEQEVRLLEHRAKKLERQRGRRTLQDKRHRLDLELKGCRDQIERIMVEVACQLSDLGWPERPSLRDEGHDGYRVVAEFMANRVFLEITEVLPEKNLATQEELLGAMWKRLGIVGSFRFAMAVRSLRGNHYHRADDRRRDLRLLQRACSLITDEGDIPLRLRLKPNGEVTFVVGPPSNDECKVPEARMIQIDRPIPRRGARQRSSQGCPTRRHGSRRGGRSFARSAGDDPGGGEPPGSSAPAHVRRRRPLTVDGELDPQRGDRRARVDHRSRQPQGPECRCKGDASEPLSRFRFSSVLILYWAMWSSCPARLGSSQLIVANKRLITDGFLADFGDQRHTSHEGLRFALGAGFAPAGVSPQEHPSRPRLSAPAPSLRRAMWPDDRRGTRW